METRSNNQQHVFIRASEIKGIRLTNYYFCTFQDLFDATFRYKDPLVIFKCVHVGCLQANVGKHANLKSQIPARPTVNIFKSDFPLLSDYFRPSGTQK